MKVLIVEDNSSQRDLLKYLLEAKFQHTTKFREADSLSMAMSYLSQEDIDCVLLDLHLPDSQGKETFSKIQSRHPHVPVIVMTDTRDRTLAVELVRQGAADYVVKSYTDEEIVFQRILLGIEKHKHTVRAPVGDAEAVRRVERARANLMAAHREGSLKDVQAQAVEVTAATADLTQRMFTEMQRMLLTLGAQSRDMGHISEVTDTLQREILEGSFDHPSMAARLDRLESVVRDLRIAEKINSHLEDRLATVEKSRLPAPSNHQKKLIFFVTITFAIWCAWVTAQVVPR